MADIKVVKNAATGEAILTCKLGVKGGVSVKK